VSTAVLLVLPVLILGSSASLAAASGAGQVTNYTRIYSGALTRESRVPREDSPLDARVAVETCCGISWQ
jgi:hypothetical protein